MKNKEENSKTAVTYDRRLPAGFKPILFSTPMVQAILKGEKTQTRRLIKPTGKQREFIFNEFLSECSFDSIHDNWAQFIHPKGGPATCFKLPYEVGNILWVRETFMPLTIGYMYKADDLHNPESKMIKWKPSLFMPEDACRIYLKLTNIRVERLNCISEEDCIAEGIGRYSLAFKDYEDENMYLFSAKESYKSLWNKINGKNAWNKNPWVWVYEFERLHFTSACR